MALLGLSFGTLGLAIGAATGVARRGGCERPAGATVVVAFVTR
jgi:hypothetical protein